MGYFSRIFLTEVKHTGDKLLGTIPTPIIQEELRNFADFLRVITNKNPEEDVPLVFQGARVKVYVLLVAKRKTISLHGIAPYVNAVRIGIQRGIENIYITGWGNDFVRNVIDIKKEVEGNFVTVLRRYDYELEGRVKGILFVCQSNLSYLAERRKLQEEVKGAMNEVVLGIKNGEIEIVSIARMRGVGCKIAVRMASGEDSYEATGACIGDHGERVIALKTYFENEFVAIVPWSDDIKEFIINALTPLRKRYVSKVEIDEENRIADVEVMNEISYTKALGKGHNNIKLARELTGWVINVRSRRKKEVMLSPEEELLEILRRYVPEIEIGEIEVVKIKRIESVGSRIVVKKSNLDNRSTITEICCGFHHERLRKIREELFGEWVYFHKWNDSPSELIANCLYPLKRRDIVCVDLDEKHGVAIINVKDRLESPPVWRERIFIELAEKVTGWKIRIEQE